MRRSTILLAAVTIAALIQPDPGRSYAESLSIATFPPGWNLVGGPAGTQLYGASGNLYTMQYKDRAYETVPAGTPLTGGLGYWAYFPSGGLADLPQDSVPCVIAVPIGAAEWVIAGNPSSSATVTVRGAERVYTYHPDTGYTPGVTLHPGQAAWAYSSVATTVAVVIDGCPTANSSPSSAPIPPPH